MDQDGEYADGNPDSQHQAQLARQGTEEPFLEGHIALVWLLVAAVFHRLSVRFSCLSACTGREPVFRGGKP